VHPPLKDKRLMRRWDEHSLDVIAEGLPAVVQRLLKWTGGKSSELYPEKLPWED
jgi:hypothetical protein